MPYRDIFEEYLQRAAVLVEALPYIREFEGKTIVIKYGGSAMEDPHLRRSTAEDVVLMKYVGMNPVLIHGGGPEINRNLKIHGIESHFHRGLRVTSDEAIHVVEMTLAGSINKDIVSLINTAGGNAVGLCGKDANLLHAEKIELEDGEDVGHVGRLYNVHYQIVNVLADNGFIPVIAPIATDPQGGTWNVNADTAAGEIAAAIEAEKLVFLTNTRGLMRDPEDPDSLLHRVDYREIQELTRSGVIAGGMIPKVEACLKALDYGVSRTHIIDGRVPHALLLEIFTEQGMGTLVSH